MLSLILVTLIAVCPQKQLDSLAGEIGDGSTIGVRTAKSIRDTAYRLIESTTDDCVDVTAKLEELAFDMETLIENNHVRK